MKSWLKIFGEILIVTVSLTPIIRADDEALLKSSRQIYCPLICESPGIDGKLDVPCWRNAENFGLFMVAGQTIPAAGQTSGKIFYDGTNLYLGVKCAGTGAPFFSCRERDSNEIWQDEVVEVFIQPGKDYNDYYHFAVNRAGTIYDSHVSPGGHDAKWNSHLQAAVFTGTNGWSVELRLPLADITPVPVNGAEWRFNVCRQSFSPLQERELSTWTYLSAETFNTPQSFGFLYFRTPDDNYRKGGEAFAKSFVKQKPHSVSQGQGPEINDNPAAGISPLAFSNIIGAISSRHPRLFINETMLSSIKTNMTASRRKLLSELQRDVDAYPLKPEIDTNDLPSDIMHRSRNDRGEQAADAALVYLLTGEKKYSEKAFNLLKKSVDYYTLQYSNNRPVSWVSTSRIGALCAFDWLYNAMSEEQRKTVGAPLLEHILQTQDTKKRPKDDGPSGPTAGFYGTPNLPWYAGIAFVKTGLNDEAALKLLEKGYSDHLKMFTFRSQATGDDGGSATPCVAYAGVGEYQRQECIFFHTWRAVMGTDFAGYFPKLAFFPNWLLWNAIPGDRLMYANCFFEFGFGDTWHLNNNTWNPSENYLGQYIYFYKQMVPEMTQIAEYLLAKMGGSDQSIYSSYDYNSVIPFLFMPNTANPAVVAFPEGIPRTRHFENLGQIFMNSGWKPDSTFCLFTAGSTRAGHKHCDENNFVIYRSGFLALDSGTREDNENYFMHQNEYYYRTIAHNCMLIRMKDEVFPVGFTYFYYPQSHNNDGGMSHTTGSKLLAFETSDYYTYVASDAAPAYNADKCDLALRQFIFVYPDYFVVCDRVVSKKPDQLKTWLLHTQNEPVLDGDTFSAGHWGGKLYCRTLLPRKYERKKIGGAGKEFWSDGRNWPIDPQRDLKGTLYGNWRMEISPVEQRKEDVFLHLLQVGDKWMNQMTPARLIETAGEVGVKFDAGDKEVTVLFNREGAAGGRINVRRGWFTTLVDQPFTNGVQQQSGLARAKTPNTPIRHVQITARQANREIKDYEIAEGLAPVEIALTSADSELQSRHLQVFADGDDIGKWVTEEPAQDNHQLRVKVNLAGYAGHSATSAHVKNTGLNTGMFPVEWEKCRISYEGNDMSGSYCFYFQLPPSHPAPSAVFLSDLKEDTWLALKGGYKWFNKDKDHNDQPLKVGSLVFKKGLMLTPPNDINKTAYVEYTIPEQYRNRTFKAVLGLNRSVAGSVVFRVKEARTGEEWKLIFDGAQISFDRDMVEIAVPLNGKERLRLEVFGGKSINNDHAVWADSRLE